MLSQSRFHKRPIFFSDGRFNCVPLIVDLRIALIGTFSILHPARVLSDSFYPACTARDPVEQHSFTFSHFSLLPMNQQVTS